MFNKSARFYDALYRHKDYAGESERLHLLIQQHKRAEGHDLLDVACGTGGHIAHLRAHYRVEGLDLNETMLAIAGARFPGVTFHQGNMVDFELGRHYDAVVCLFSSIGYLRTEAELMQAVDTMARHLYAGGVLVVEPWFTAEAWKKGRLGSLFVNEPDLRIARMNIAEVEGQRAVMLFHYLMGTPERIDYFTERHELSLFSVEQYLGAFRVAGLAVVYQSEGLTGRGLYIGVKP